MNKHSIYRKPLAILLAICLLLPGAAFGIGKSGKKNFGAGVKYEVAEQWDLAAQEFALAVAAEPSNAEYRLHLSRALTNAAVMFIKRGDALNEQNDFQSAYNAYRQAYAYDPTNEMARVKMNNMIERQKAQSGIGLPVNYNRIGNVVPTSGDVGIQQKPRSKDAVQLFEYKDTPLKTVIIQTAKQLGLNVLFDDSFKEPPTKFSISLQNVTVAKAFDYVLMSNKLIFEQLDRRTILIYQDSPTNRQRIEKMMVKTFYLGNADLNDARNLVQQMLQTGGQQRQIAIVKQLNALVVRAPLQDLKLAQEILESLDKNRPEVMLDVNIYEISNSTSFAIGNQLATSGVGLVEHKVIDGKVVDVPLGTSASLGNLGGFGRNGVTGVVGAGIAGNIITPFGLGTVFGLPPTSLSLLQSQGNSKLLAQAQVHALDGEAGKTVVGRSVPVRTGTNYVPGYSTTPNTTAGAATNAATQLLGGGVGNSGAFDNIQYKDVGLVIDMTPKITNEGYVEIKMSLESSNVEASGADSTLTPSFTKRQLTTVSRIQDGQTGIVAGVKQENKGNSRVSIPVIGMLPILGRLFSTPQQNSQLTDIVITVTPHIVRSAEIKVNDHLAKFGGTSTSGPGMSIEDVVMRAQAEDDMDRRIIAQENQQQQQQAVQPDALVGAANGIPLGTSLNTAARIAETTAPGTTNPSPKVEAPNFAGQNSQVPVNTTAANGTMPSTGLTPPPASNGFQPPPNNATRPQMQNVSLTEKAPVTAPPASNGTGKSSPAIPVESPSISNVVTQPNTVPTTNNQTTTRQAGGQGTIGNPPPVPNQQTAPPNGAASSPRVTPVNRPTVDPAKGREMANQTKSDTEEIKPPAGFEPPVLEGPKEPVAPATVKMRPMIKTKDDTGANEVPGAAKGPKNGVELSLLCQPKQQVGKSFIVVVSLNGEAQITGANVALKYDASKLEFKAVHDGGLFNNRGELTHQNNNGTLVINLQQTEDKVSPVKANGKFVVIEFTALESGETSIDFHNAETQFKLADSAVAQISANPVKLEIGPEAK